MKIHGLQLIAIILLLGAMCTAQTYIYNVNVIDLSTGTILRDKIVLIPPVLGKSGKPYSIVRIKGDYAVEGLKRSPGKHIDGTGKYLMPSLWDMHVHVAGITAKPAWTRELLAVYLANGVTAVRDMGGDWSALRPIRDASRGGLVKRGEMRLPSIHAPGPFLDAETKGYGSPSEVIGVKTPEEARAAVRKLAAEKVDFIKTGSRLSPEAFRAIAAECKKLKLPFVGHVPDAVSVEEASDLGMNSMEHLFGMQLALTGREAEFRRRVAELRAKSDRDGIAKLNEEIENSFDPKAAEALFAKFNRNHTWIVPTLVWTKTATTLASVQAEDPRLRYVPKALRDEWTPEKAATIFSPRGVAFYKKKFANDMKLVKMMSDAGVQLLAGSDSLDPYVFPGDSLHEELELMVEAGLTPLQALNTATMLPRQFLGRSSTSQFILLDGNPLEDIRNVRKISAVIYGNALERKDLDALLSAVEEKFKH